MKAEGGRGRELELELEHGSRWTSTTWDKGQCSFSKSRRSCSSVARPAGVQRERACRGGQSLAEAMSGQAGRSVGQVGQVELSG